MGGDARERLLVMRHSHAMPATPGGEDHDRPLARRGITEAMARRDVIAPLAPDLVLCSSARRAVETMDALTLGVKSEVDPSIYDASPEGLLNRLAEVPADTGTVLLIGHLPTVEVLVRVLLGEDHAAMRSFRPASVAVLARAAGWADLSYDTCTLEAFHS